MSKRQASRLRGRTSSHRSRRFWPGYPQGGSYPQGGAYPQDGGYQPGPGYVPGPGGPTGGPQFPYGPPPQPRKRHRLRTWLLIASAVFAGLIAAVIAIAIAAGNAANKAANPVAVQPSVTPASQTSDTSTPTPTPTGPEILSVGQTETVGNASTNATSATITVESVSVTTQPAQSYGSAPANGYFVVVQVKATCDPSYTGGFPINELDFYDLVRGHHYDPGNGNSYSALSDSQTNQSITATLGAGETSSGWIAFDVPRSHGYIVYAPNANGQPLAEWKY